MRNIVIFLTALGSITSEPVDPIVTITPDDTRYTTESARYWRSLGLTISNSQIQDQGPPAVPTSEQTPNALINQYHWDTDPIIVNGERRWRIRYGFAWKMKGEGKKMSADFQDFVREALQLIENDTCFTFEEVTDNDGLEFGILKYFTGSGCWSYTGRYEGHDNWISIGRGCQDISTIQHETMHALGFGHEQERPDRDDYVTVHFENIREGKEGNFGKMDKSEWEDMNSPFDYSSVMQYGGGSFGDGKTTISYKLGARKGQQVVSQNIGISSMDIYQMCNVYKCERCAGLAISSYEGKAHEKYMIKCQQTEPEQYVWPNRCMDGWEECEFGEDEIEETCQAGPTTTTSPTTTPTIAPTTQPTTQPTTAPTSTIKSTTQGPVSHSCNVEDLATGVKIVSEGSGKNADGTYQEGGYISTSCDEGFADSLNRPKVKQTCKCDQSTHACSFVPAKGAWTCVDQAVCPLPYWGGNKFSYVKIVTDKWSQLKSRFKPDPTFGDMKFWKTSDWTSVVVCNQDLRKVDGSDGIVALEMYTRSHSDDGRAWTMINRPGFHFTKREKGSYFKIMIDSPNEPFDWTVGGSGQATCWIGVIDGHWPHLAQCLGQNYTNNGLRCTKCW